MHQEVQSLDDLLAFYVRERIPSEGMERQLWVVTRSFRGATGISQLLEIKRDNLLGWRDHLLKARGVSDTTWNNYLRHMKVLLNFAQENGWGDWHHLKGVKRLPERKRQKRTVNHDGVAGVLAYLRHTDQQHMPGWFWETVVKTLYYTGIRRRQLVGLHWEDIGWHDSTITLRAETSKTRTEWVIPMAQPLQAELGVLERESRTRLGRRCLPGEQVFNVTLFNPHYKAKGMTVDHVSAAFRRIREQTGVAVSAHRFRHTFASQLAKQGRIKELQQVMGHTDVRTTLGYVQPDLEGMAELVGGLACI
jgi:integrase